MTNSRIKRQNFPPDFVFGTATSSYQIEGTRFGTCGQNHWDKFALNGGTANGQDGAIACAHIENWQTDINLISDCGLGAYRFSIAWPRIQPDGSGPVNQSGLDFYDALIDGLLARGIEPHLTLYHWDLPLTLANNGGWTNQGTAKRFADYSEIIFNSFGDRLSSIATVNEPWCVAWLSHFLGHHAPGLTDITVASKAMHNILLAHGLAIETLRGLQTGTQQAPLGIVLNMEAATPFSALETDRYATKIYDGIYNRWFADAIFHGTYPNHVLEFLEPHLPKNWQQDMAIISQPIDWLGLNYYTRNFIQNDGKGSFPFGGPVQPEFDPENPNRTAMNWEVFPQGLCDFLLRLEKEYTKGLPIFVSENGMANFDQVENGAVHDSKRIDYFERHLSSVKQALDQGANVQGYFAWSLLDNFEWAFGYDQRFGIVHVDFETQKRTPKASWHWWQDFLGSKF